MIEGVLNIYKPSGPTSFDVVYAARKMLRLDKAGHIGTLDPMAEGVLPVCVNQATRVAQFLTHLPKVYRARMVLGVETDTYDATGKTVREAAAQDVDAAAVKQALQTFVGRQEQIPPMFSAKKQNGQPLYKLARQGITVERRASLVEIYSITLLQQEGNEVTFQVHCSSGTYVRSLCHDVGVKLGCGAHMAGLVRLEVGLFRADAAIALADLEKIGAQEDWAARVTGTREALAFLPEIFVKAEFAGKVANGVAPSRLFLASLPERLAPGMLFRLSRADGVLLAIAEALVDAETFAQLPAANAAFRMRRVFPGGAARPQEVCGQICQ